MAQVVRLHAAKGVAVGAADVARSPPAGSVIPHSQRAVRRARRPVLGSSGQAAAVARRAPTSCSRRPSTPAKEGRSMRGLKFTKANLDELKAADREYFVWSAICPASASGSCHPASGPGWSSSAILPVGPAGAALAACRSCRTRSRPSARAATAGPCPGAPGRPSREGAGRGAGQVEKRRKSTIGAIVAAYLSESETRAKRSFGEIERYLQDVWAEILHPLDAEICTATTCCRRCAGSPARAERSAPTGHALR